MNWERFLSDKLNSKQYAYKSDAKKDILKTLKTYPDLYPKEDSYVHNDGRVHDLLSLYGTIPMIFKGANYNIPIQIWLLQRHPINVPVVFVRPTSSMVVKPSRHVDSAGRVYHPYLSQWHFPRSDTCGMIAILQSVFSQESPVFAKPNMAPSRPMQPPTYPDVVETKDGSISQHSAKDDNVVGNVNVPDALASKAILEWSIDDVCCWLDHLNLSQYKTTFTENDIEGKHLPELSKDELKELGVAKLGHRMTLHDAIARLNVKN